MSKPSVFISSSHKDEDWKDRLVTHLGVLQEEGWLDIWEDRQILAVMTGYQKLKKRLTGHMLPFR